MWSGAFGSINLRDANRLRPLFYYLLDRPIRDEESSYLTSIRINLIGGVLIRPQSWRVPSLMAETVGLVEPFLDHPMYTVREQVGGHYQRTSLLWTALNQLLIALVVIMASRLMEQKWYVCLECFNPKHDKFQFVFVGSEEAFQPPHHSLFSISKNSHFGSFQHSKPRLEDPLSPVS